MSADNLAMPWPRYLRDDSAIILLEAAADVIDHDGPVPVSVTLARAGAQFFADAVRRIRGERALFALGRSMEEQTKVPGRAKWLTSLVLESSNSIKHSNRDGEAAEVALSHDLASLLIFCAMGDLFIATGKVSEKLQSFRRHQVAKLHGALGANPARGLTFREAIPKLQEAVARWQAEQAAKVRPLT